MPRRAHCVFHLVEGNYWRDTYWGVDIVSMPRRAHCVFHHFLLLHPSAVLQIAKFQCPEGLIVYFTNCYCRYSYSCWPYGSCVSMPRRAHCVFHRKEAIEHWNNMGFNAPKGSLCISPSERSDMNLTIVKGYVSMPRRAHCVFHQSSTKKRCRMPKLWVSMPRRAHCVFHRYGSR